MMNSRNHDLRGYLYSGKFSARECSWLLALNTCIAELVAVVVVALDQTAPGHNSWISKGQRLFPIGCWMQHHVRMVRDFWAMDGWCCFPLSPTAAGYLWTGVIFLCWDSQCLLSYGCVFFFLLFNIQIAYLHTCFKLTFLEHGNQINYPDKISPVHYTAELILPCHVWK